MKLVDRRAISKKLASLGDRPGAAGAGGGVEAEPFSEKRLQQVVTDLLEAKDVNRATKVLVDALPGLYESKINIKEKLSNLIYLPRAIQAAGGAKYGYAKLQTKFKSLERLIGTEPLPDGGFVELGCGAHDPISLSTYFYLNGARPNFAIDLLPPRMEVFSAASMYETLANIKMFPGRYVRKGVKPFELLERLRSIDVAAFERGDFEAGLASIPDTHLIIEDFLAAPIENASIALFTSFAVLEHVTDIHAIAKRIFEVLVPGGTVFHFVDLADHRSYRGDGAYGPLAFLGEPTAPENMNRLRAPEITAAHVDAGFQVVSDTRVTAAMPPEVAENLLARLKTMPMEDVTAIKQSVVFRKPL